MAKDKEFRELFQEMIQSIENKIELHAFILFGSRARGNALPHSDYDVLIIGDFEKKYLSRSQWVIKCAPLIPMDIFCYTEDEFNQLFHQYNLTAIDAVDEGIILRGHEFMNKYEKKLAFFKEKGMKKGDHILYPPSI
jgi:predicted nucleotidyltransferase